MRSLQLAKKAILLLLQVLVFVTSSPTSALGVASGLASGMTTIEPLKLGEVPAVLSSSPDPETATTVLPIAIRAVSPGYTLPAGKNSGELIELVNLSSDELDLSGVAIIYISKPSATYPEGKSTTLYVFPDEARFVGESILLRYASSPEAMDGAQDLTYDATSLAMEGSLKLMQGETIISSVCWLGGEDCLPIFSTTVKSRAYTTIVRNNDTGEYLHTNNYVSLYDPESPGLYLPSRADDLLVADDSSEAPSDPTPAESTTPVCSGLEFSEIFTYYEDDPSEQFIEFYNSSSTDILLDRCRLRYKNKTYILSATPFALKTNSYYVFHPPIALTKNPTTSNRYEILDITDDVVDVLDLPHGQKKSASFALIGKSSDGSPDWQVTYLSTPGTANIYQEFRTCPAGKVINTTTGNCVNATTLSSINKDCPAGKYRNPATGRCKSYDSDDGTEATPCKEGYERSPETNRCRKIKQNNGADYPLVPMVGTEDSSSFVALWALLGVFGLGLLYVLFQFRRDIYYTLRRFIGKFRG